MKRLRFVAASGAALLGACSAHGGSMLPSLVRAQSNSRDGFSPAGPLPQPAILGECRRFDGASAPAGWAMCDGSLLRIEQNPQLYKILGRSAGGDGRTTFALPKSYTFPFVISTAGVAVSSPKQLAAIFAQRERRGAAPTKISPPGLSKRGPATPP
ncbi:MAG: phage tail protein [Vulcanimicrobiaceae bacterium]